MTSSFRFVHSADLHLDAPFKGIGVEDENLKRRIRQSSFKALENMVSLCLKEKVHALLLAGDVFDRENRSIRAQFRFSEQMERLAEGGVEVFLVHGNHDPLTGEDQCLVELPANVHLFGTEEVEEKFLYDSSGNVVTSVFGISYHVRDEQRNLARHIIKKAEEKGKASPFQIALLHCKVGDITPHKPYAPCLLSELTASDIDYWALGHIHEGCILSEKPWVVYPGNTQGRSMREQGERGCRLVTVENGKVASCAFIPLEDVRWQRLSFDVRGFRSLVLLKDALISFIRQESDQKENQVLLCRIELTGEAEEEMSINTSLADTLCEELRYFSAGKKLPVWIQEVEDKTVKPFLLSQLAEDTHSLLGRVLHQVNAGLRKEEGSEFEEFLSPLFKNKHIRGYLEELSEEEYKIVLKEAQSLCIQELSS